MRRSLNAGERRRFLAARARRLELGLPVRTVDEVLAVLDDVDAINERAAGEPAQGVLV